MADKPLIIYIRVSSSQQGRSGLGIEAQRETLRNFAASEGFEVTREFVEVETGKGADALDRRPQLKAALAAARKAAAAACHNTGARRAIEASCKFRFGAHYGLRSDIAACPKRADSVAKVPKRLRLIFRQAKDETSDNRGSMQPQTLSRNRLCFGARRRSPHIIIRSSRPRVGEFESPLPQKDFYLPATDSRAEGSTGGNSSRVGECRP
jgi:Resolvase, N terminal domain